MAGAFLQLRPPLSPSPTLTDSRYPFSTLTMMVQLPRDIVGIIYQLLLDNSPADAFRLASTCRTLLALSVDPFQRFYQQHFLPEEDDVWNPGVRRALWYCMTRRDVMWRMGHGKGE